MRISDATYERLRSHARPFEDRPEDVINAALDALDEKRGRSKPPTPTAPAAPVKAAAKKQFPQRELRPHILKVLLDLGGSGETADIRAALEKRLAPYLTDVDYATVSNGDPRWWNRVCFERADLVREHLFEKPEMRGVWELSEAGRAAAKAI
jgi:hypothetical protein